MGVMNTTRRAVYVSGATFIPVCSFCKRYVKADASIELDYAGGLKDQPNATCARCGRVRLQFEVFIDEI